MPQAVSALIAKLKKQMPELKDNPLLDDIEAAAYAPEDGDVDASDEALGDEESPDMMAGDEEALADDAMAAESDEADMADDEAALEDEEPAPAPKAKKGPPRKMPKMSNTKPFM